MNSCVRTAGRIALGGLAAALFVAVVHAQSILGKPSPANHFIETPAGWVHPKTPWGDPDLEGMWPISYVGTVPLERCAGGFRGRGNAPPCDLNKAWLTDDEDNRVLELMKQEEKDLSRKLVAENRWAATLKRIRAGSLLDRIRRALY